MSPVLFRVKNQVRAAWKLCLSLRKRDWGLAHPELAEDFIHRVLNLDWAWISDESSLWDFHHDETNNILIPRIKEVDGIYVSDIQSAKVSEILERIAAVQDSA